MESICKIFWKTGTISEDDELVLMDYLYDNNIRVNLDCPEDKLVRLALSCKFKSQNEIDRFLRDEEDTKGGEGIKGDIKPHTNRNYGLLGINLYLKIALISDHKTLISMMNVSRIHREKFDDIFFQNYLKRYYPLSLNYITNHLKYNYSIDQKTSKKYKIKKYKDYYFDYIKAKNMLKAICDFDPLENSDVIEINKNSQRMISTGLDPHDYINKMVRRL